MYQCDMIEYFSQEVYSPDPNDSSQAIPYAVTKSIVFVLLGSIFVVIGFIVCLMGQCMDNKSRYTLISGVIFIQTDGSIVLNMIHAGSIDPTKKCLGLADEDQFMKDVISLDKSLAMLCGLVVYIAVFKSEVGSKLRPKSQLQPAAFEYQYGYSFIVYVTGVVFTKASGVSCVFLYIYRSQYGWRRHQLKYAKENSIPKTVNTFPEQEEPPILYPCERHPQAYINSNSSIRYTRNPLLCERNYFSRKQNNVAPCRIHHRISQSNSLKDISIFYNFPPPPLVSYKFGHHLSANDLENFESFSRDVTANTMSTTCDEFITNDDYLLSNENEFVTFEFDKPSAKRIFEMDSLRRTTPV